MGLDCSHDAFHGAYSAFNRLRQYVARVSGGSFPPHSEEYMRAHPDMDRDWCQVDDDVVPPEHMDTCLAFLLHSDCDGEFSSEECGRVSLFLDWVAEHGDAEPTNGHLSKHADMRGAVLKFSSGCREANEDGEPLTFG